MNNLKVVIRLENVMINGFDVESNYEKDLKRRLNYGKVKDRINLLENEIKEWEELKKEVEEEEMKEFKVFRKVLLSSELSLEDFKKVIIKKENEKKGIGNEIKLLRKEIDKISEEFEVLMEEKSKEEKDFVIKRMKKEYDDRFENLNLKNGVKEIFDRLLKLKFYFKDVDMKIVVMSDVRSLKVKRLLNNVGLDFCEVVNSSVEGWRENLVEENYEIMLVESKEELVGLIDKVKLFLLDEKRLRA